MSTSLRLSFTADWQQTPPVSVGVPLRPKIRKSASLFHFRSHSRLIKNLRIGTKLQEIGREWGTSTGRRRRCGWLDLVVVSYSNSINYYTSLNLTKLDVLDTFETIKIAIAYKVDGQELESYPADLEILERAEVVYHEMPGWQTPTTNAKSYYDLPKKARDYVEYIEKFVGVKIKYIGTGPEREAMIQRA
jgi:adenylosuccinate synthase